MLRAETTSPPRYHSFSRYCRRRFGCRVRKITLDAGFTCPNRDGTCGWGGCTFCNNSGFSPNTRHDPASVHEQLVRGIHLGGRRGISRFIAYFQAYTNTYAPIESLRALYDEVWRFKQVLGMSVGTRPDCVNPAIINLLAGYTQSGEVWVEYGLQSAHDATLMAINRGHGYREFLDAVEMTRDRGLKICVHTILGLPGEDRDMMLETHRRLAGLPIDGIKIHLLHIMRGTVMEHQFLRGDIRLLGRPEYVSLVCDCLEILPPTITIQRLHADAPPDVLVAPDWCMDKSGILDDIRRELDARDAWQGKQLGFPLAP